MDAAAFAAQEGEAALRRSFDKSGAAAAALGGSRPATPGSPAAAGSGFNPQNSAAISVSGVSVNGALARHNSGELPISSFGGDKPDVEEVEGSAREAGSNGHAGGGGGVAMACLPLRKGRAAPGGGEDDAASTAGDGDGDGDGSQRSHGSRALLVAGGDGAAGGRRQRPSPLAACLPSRRDPADGLPDIAEDEDPGQWADGATHGSGHGNGNGNGAASPQAKHQPGRRPAANNPNRSFRRAFLEMLRKRYLIQKRDFKGFLTNVALPVLVIALVMLVLFLDIDPAGPELQLRASTLAVPNASKVLEGSRKRKVTEVPYSRELETVPPGWLRAYTEDATLRPVDNTPTGYALSKALLKMPSTPWCAGGNERTAASHRPAFTSAPLRTLAGSLEGPTDPFLLLLDPIPCFPQALRGLLFQ